MPRPPEEINVHVEETWKERAFQISRTVLAVTAIVAAAWWLAKPHVEGFVVQTVHAKYEGISARLSGLETKQAELAKNQGRVEESVKFILDMQRETRDDVKELLKLRKKER